MATAVTTRINVPRGAVWLLVALCLPAVSLILLNRPLYAMGALALPFLAALMLMPRPAYYLYLLSVSIYFAIPTGAFALWPCDLMLAVMAASVVIDVIVRGEVKADKTPFDLLFLGLIIVTWISAIFSMDIAMSIVPSVRVLVLYASFRVSYRFCREIGPEKMLKFYLGHIFVLSLINIAIFVLKSDNYREFGPARLAFENYAMTAVPMAAAFFLLTFQSFKRVVVSVIILTILFAVVISGSRGTMLAIILTLPIVFWTAAGIKGLRGQPHLPKAQLKLFVLVGVVAAVVIIAGSAVFGRLIARLEEMTSIVQNPQGTIALRYVLWKAAWQAFLTDPLTGLGIGNFNLVDRAVPSIKLEPVWWYIRGISAHHIVLHYMAETGIFGGLIILAFGWKGVSTARKCLAMSRTFLEQRVGLALIAAMAAFFITLFFMRAWTWAQEGHIMAFLFGLCAAAYNTYKDRELPAERL